MMDLIAQVWIAVCGCSSVWLVARRDHWKRWGYIAGMLGQPAWVYTTIHHEQWGITLLTLWYTYSWGMGIWNYWIRPAKVESVKPTKVEPVLPAIEPVLTAESAALKTSIMAFGDKMYALGQKHAREDAEIEAHHAKAVTG